MDAKFPKGHPTTATTTGGATTHSHTEGAAGHQHTASHSHTQSMGAAGSSLADATQSSPVQQISRDGSHSDHSIGNTSTTAPTASAVSPRPTTDTDTNLPSRYTVIWIQSDGSTDVPSGCIMWWATAGGAPTDWALCDGTGGQPDLREYFLTGAAGGGNGGTATAASAHNHALSHSHNITTHLHTSGAIGSHTDAATVSLDIGGGNTGVIAGHGHTLTIPNDTPTSGTTAPNTSDATPDPPYHKLHHVKRTSAGAGIAVGLIGAWNGSSATIPAGWTACDGTAGTPNLNGGEKYLKGATGDGQIGTTGGALTHSHTFSGTHLHTVGAHTHSSPVSTSAPAFYNMVNTLSDSHMLSHQHAVTIGNGGTPNTGSATAATTTSDNQEPPFYTVLFIQILSQVITDTDTYTTSMTESEAVNFVIEDTDTYTSSMTEAESVHAISLTVDSPLPDEALTQSDPTVLWTVSGGTQQTYQVVVTSDAAGLNVVYDSGEVISGNAYHQIPSGYLQVNSEYWIWVTVTDTEDLTATAAAVHVTTAFSTSVNVTNLRAAILGGDCGDTGLPGVALYWSQVVPGAGEAFVSYDVYRQEAGGSNIRIAQITAIGTVHYEDYTACPGTTYLYTVTWEATGPSGTLVSVPQSPAIQGRVTFDWTFLHEKSHPQNYVRLPAYEASYTVQQPSSIYRVWGRSKPTIAFTEGFSQTVGIQVLDQMRHKPKDWRNLLTMLERQATNGEVLCLRVGVDRVRLFVQSQAAGRQASNQLQYTQGLNFTEVNFEEAV